MNNQSKLSSVLRKYTASSANLTIQENSVAKRAFLFGPDNKYNVSVASDFSSRQESYELIYNLYSSKEINYVAYPDPSKMWYSIFNASPFTQTVNIKDTFTNKLVGTLTVVLDSIIGLPLEEQYSDILENFRNKNRHCFEIISLGVIGDSRDAVEILNHLFTFSYYIGKGYFGGTDYLIMIKPSHSAFYEKRLLFTKISEEVILKKINNNPVALFHLPVERIELQAKKLIQQPNNKNGDLYASFCEGLNDKELMFKLFECLKRTKLTLVELIYFFVNKKDIFYQTDSKKLKALANLYKSSETQQYLIDLVKEKEVELIVG